MQYPIIKAMIRNEQKEEIFALPIFLKWAGGKRRILKNLEPLFPERVERYFEPFLGAGSIFFFIKQKYRPRFSLISDANADLIQTYKTVRDAPDRLINFLKYFKKNNSEEFYYKVRKDLNEHAFEDHKRSAAFIYLNKTCYNGLYRVNLKNEFNVPYGRYESPEIYSSEGIMKASELLQGVQIECQDYQAILPSVKKGDFVYLDPCYDPIKRTSFVHYTPDRFSISDRNDLFEFIATAKNRGAKILLSNNNIPEIRKLYTMPKFKIHEIEAFRSVGSKKGSRDKVIELAISSY